MSGLAVIVSPRAVGDLEEIWAWVAIDFYRIHENCVEVVRFLHGRRDITALF